MITAPLGGLRGKLYALALANAAAMTLLVVIAWLAYGHIERLSVTLVDREMARIYDNARLGRLMSESLAQIDRDTRDCRTSAQPESGQQGSPLSDLTNSTSNQELAQTLAVLAESAQRLQSGCRAIGDIWMTIEAHDRYLLEELDRLEVLISRAMIEQTLAGKNTDHLDQIMALTVGYRESALLIGKALSLEGITAYGNGAIGLIDDLRLRLKTMTAATPEMARLTRRMYEESVPRYRSLLLSLRGAEATFAAVQQENRRHRDAMLEMIHEHDVATGQRAEDFRDELTQITAQTAQQIAWIGGTIAVLSLLLVGGFVQRGIQRPLSAVLRQIAAIRDGQVLKRTPQDVFGDEWGTILTSLDDMARDLAAAQSELVELSRTAGMAEVATGVLHNVGNVLNSVNVSSNVLIEQLRESRVGNVARVAEMMAAEAGGLERFLREDPRGQLIPAYLASLAEALEQERKLLLTEAQSLHERIDHIKEIVAMQQSYGRVIGVLETLPPEQLMEDALRLQADGLSRDGITVLREYGDVPNLTVDKHKVLQILLNLISNARYACAQGPASGMTIFLRISSPAPNLIRMEVVDRGVGISPENLTRIFQHGFTTRPDGHGFGLHSGALAARELGGSLIAHSDGVGHGATFTLELPIRPEVCT